MHPVVKAVTARIKARSAGPRAAYLALIDRETEAGLRRGQLSCSNLAHGFAAALEDQATLRGGAAPNIGIVTAYNDMLSAHQPYGRYPEQIKLFAREVGATAQVAGGVPAMCDGVTQGQAGMELSLLSRDTIALAASVALSHAMFEGAALLGICDKIVPGLLIAALRFGHLPSLFIPAGPMPSGLSNKAKAEVRQRHAAGQVGAAELLASESAAYHAPGTCTFYGTANSNQMLLEMMGLQLPGSSFVNPGTQARQDFTRAAVHQLVANTGDSARALGRILDERSLVNAVVGLLATGGSTNHAIHLPAIARAAGLILNWQDMDELSRVTPLIAQVYPGGSADVNAFQAAGGMGFVIAELLSAGLLHPDINTIAGPYADWASPRPSADLDVLAPATTPFHDEGGLRLVTGNMGRAIIKTSAIPDDRWQISAPARVFEDQDAVLAAFKAGELNRDVIIVVRFQGPRANGMPELHKLTPSLGLLQDRGYKVALVTDGRMSGASGKIPAAIHLCPEAMRGGPLAQLQDGDMLHLDAHAGTLTTSADIFTRAAVSPPAEAQGLGRELFALMRRHSPDAEAGACALLDL